MQTGREGERGANPTRGTPLSVYGSHLAHDGGKVSVTAPSGVICTALSRHVVIGSYTREPSYGGVVLDTCSSFPTSFQYSLLFGLAIICDHETPELV